MELYHSDEKPQQICWDRKYYSTFEENLEALKESKTVYVGNLSFFTTEAQILGLCPTLHQCVRTLPKSPLSLPKCQRRHQYVQESCMNL